MSRSTPEWIGSNDDAAIPRAVKARIITRQDGKCALTGVKLVIGSIHFDHIVPLRDQKGGHRESNLQAVWDKPHREKTALEATERAKVERLRAKQLGIYPKSKRPLGGGLRRKMDGTVVKR